MERISKLLKELPLQSISTNYDLTLNQLWHAFVENNKTGIHQSGAEWVVKYMEQGYFDAEDAADAIVQSLVV